MIVCHCARVNDAVIRELAGESSNLDELTATCGAGGRCGGCRPTLETLIAQHRDQLQDPGLASA